ncbi:LYR motif-containing protein 2 [Cucumis melo var. makuwa]|uniref:LYR motif-containing protein 2 n=2 Tax=Cucumis melo TaxID=3656 RepID=A0A5D3E7B8_CUCMM|nr:LYR motif-containing protein 2 [Cucumis melo var. makuwa]
MVFSHDLREFILRARVLKLYRQGLRIARKAPVDGRDELRHMMREEMEKNRKCNDRQKIRFLLSEGIERLKQLDEMLDMQGH